MKKILSIILTAAMLLSSAVLSVGATDDVVGVVGGTASAVSTAESTQTLDADQKDAQGIYYTLDAETKTAIVGMDTYSDSASAGATADSIVIPETVVFGGETYAVTAIGRNAFDGTSVREVVILGTPVIGEFAFAGCTSLETVYASGATEIKGFAFWGCSKLNLVNITGAKTIGGGAFWNCSNLTVISLNADTIMTMAFAETGLTDVVFLGATAPAVAADAFPAEVIGYISAGATGYDALGFLCIDMGTVFAVESVYAKAGETVEVAVYFLNSNGASAGSAFEFDILLDDGLTIDGVIYGTENGTLAESATVNNNTITGTVSADAPSVPVVILKIKVADNATGALAVNVTPNISALSLPGSVTVCDHANTKTLTVKSASCTEAGEAQVVCAACYTVLETKTIEATEHSHKDFVIAPTCTEGGYTRHICECCADSYSDAETEALGHSWNEGEVKVEASTSKEGLVRYTCTTCGAINEVTTPKLPKKVYADVNEDGKINLSDVSLILQSIAKWDMSQKKYNADNADVNDDGKVNLGDVSMILKYIAKWDITFGPAK